MLMEDVWPVFTAWIKVKASKKSLIKVIKAVVRQIDPKSQGDNL